MASAQGFQVSIRQSGEQDTAFWLSYADRLGHSRIFILKYGSGTVFAQWLFRKVPICLLEEANGTGNGMDRQCRGTRSPVFRRDTTEKLGANGEKSRVDHGSQKID